MQIDPELMKELIQIFKLELDEQVQSMTNALLSLEKLPEADSARQEIINSIFRSAHNIKGAARGIGVTSVADVAHHIESLFSSVQKQTLPVSTALIDLCLQAMDVMRAGMQHFLEHNDPNFKVSEMVALLQQGLNNQFAEPQPKPAEAKPQTFTVEPGPRLEAVIAKAEKATQAKVAREDKSREALKVSVHNMEKIYALMEELQVNKIAIDDFYEEVNQVYAQEKILSTIWRQLSALIKDNQHVKPSENIERLILAANDSFQELDDSTYHLHKNMRIQLNEFSLVSNSLQAEVRRLRLVPVSDFLCTLPRYVRELANELEKKVELKLIGGEVKMDKLVLNELKDPIIHLIRNAIDHGIGSPAERLAAGKAEVGTIKIEINENGSLIYINISDDGEGISAQKIAKTLKAKALASDEELASMSRADLFEYIFRPGFSTKGLITSISGRGVGLDVVRTNLLKLKGQVSVDSVEGESTTFTLRVPLTLSSERGVLVRSHDQHWIIPSHSIEHVSVVSSKEILEVEGAQVVMFNEHPVILCALEEVLGQGQSPVLKITSLPLVIIKKGSERVALLVDEIVGEREIVLKPLNAPFAHVPCVSGGTLLERNQVVIVLNPNELVDRALHKSMQGISLQSQIEVKGETIHILVVDDSITTRTLEKNILEAKNFKVTVAVNGKDAWDLLQNQKFSLMITDVQMPFMDGFTLTDKVKKDERLRLMPVIIVTSLNSADEKARGVSVGADAYIVKNEFESGALLNVVEQLV